MTRGITGGSGPEVSLDDELANLISRSIIIASRGSRAFAGSGFVVREIKRYRSHYVEFTRYDRKSRRRRKRRKMKRRRKRRRQWSIIRAYDNQSIAFCLLQVTLENYYSNLIAQHIERKQRLAKLEESLKDEGLSEQQKQEKRLQHAQKETEFLRLKRSRLGVEDFEPLKVIGRGAFGEVRRIDRRSRYTVDQ